MSAAAATPACFPWREVMGMGLGLLRLSPETFWSMTPRELDAAIGAFADAAGRAPSRADLVGLMGAFPDIVSKGTEP